MILQKISINSGENTPEFDVYLNNKDEIFFGESSQMGSAWFVIDKEDWEYLKTFIDTQFKAIEQKGEYNG